ncbi:hypothetical protein [Mucilaginibacter sp.]|uniref:hypothetical protein n=1 Tax=Mucilaginibacter sp. TaxID=1882438 RepID=UPI003B000DA7
MDKADFVAAYASKARGTIINQIIFLERVIDEFLSGYFCDNLIKKRELMELHLGDKLPFEVKRNIFSILLKDHYPDFLIKHPKLIKDIISVIEHRNIFAHYLLDTGEEALTILDDEIPKIGFIRYKKNTETIWYTSEKINEIVAQINRCVYAVIELLPEE